jgi:hypothetical protein
LVVSNSDCSRLTAALTKLPDAQRDAWQVRLPPQHNAGMTAVLQHLRYPGPRVLPYTASRRRGSGVQGAGTWFAPRE